MVRKSSTERTRESGNRFAAMWASALPGPSSSMVVAPSSWQACIYADQSTVCESCCANFSQPAARSGSNPHQSHSTRASPRGACSALSPGILLKTVNSPQSVAGYEMERRHRGLWLCLHRYALLPRTARVSECGCDAVVLGCTELPLVLNDSNHRCALLTQRGF